MAHMSTDGKKFTNRPPMMAHNRSLSMKAGTAPKVDPLGQPGGPEDMETPEQDDKPVHTVHHPEGHHTTTHESGQEHDSQNLEELKGHLDKFLGEEQGEPSEDHEPEYE